jgi:hypothetical protein
VPHLTLRILYIGAGHLQPNCVRSATYLSASSNQPLGQ